MILVYLGPHLRPVLGNVAPGSKSVNRMDKSNNTESDPSSSWVSRVTKAVPASLGSMWSQRSQTARSEEGITFADMAPYLIVTEESLHDVSARLAEGLEMDVTKFRPNIVLSGSAEPWEEDFWGGLKIIAKDDNTGELRDGEDDDDENEDVQRKDRIMELVLTSNCARCRSINVDYETGKQGTGEKGSVLKKLMHDRRVDKGMKYNPVFGRYAFLVPPTPTSKTTYGKPRPQRATGRRRKISVGDEVFVSKRNESRTIVGKTRLLSSQGILSSIDKWVMQSGRAWLASSKGSFFFNRKMSLVWGLGSSCSYDCGNQMCLATCGNRVSHLFHNGGAKGWSFMLRWGYIKSVPFLFRTYLGAPPSHHLKISIPPPQQNYIINPVLCEMHSSMGVNWCRARHRSDAFI